MQCSSDRDSRDGPARARVLTAGDSSVLAFLGERGRRLVGCASGLTRICFFGDLAGLAELFDHQVHVVVLDDSLSIGSLVAGDEDETLRVGAYRLIVAERQS